MPKLSALNTHYINTVSDTASEQYLRLSKFHSFGAFTEKALSPLNFKRDNGTVNNLSEDDLGSRRGVGTNKYLMCSCHHIVRRQTLKTHFVFCT